MSTWSVIFCLFIVFAMEMVHAVPVSKMPDYYDDYDEDIPDDLQVPVVPPQVAHNATDFQNYLVKFLDGYYDKYVRKIDVRTPKPSAVDIYEEMQSDQPVTQNVNIHQTPNGSDYSALKRGVHQEYEGDERRDKNNWIELLKNKILKQVGRENSSLTKIEDNSFPPINISDIIPTLLNTTTPEEDQMIAEKIRSYYPSCEIPRNTDQEVWKEENTMNLYFNFDHSPEDNGVNIATATLRLYRLPQDNSSSGFTADPACENNPIPPEDEKLFRISIYWYTRSLRKHRVKRRLCDSKVVGEHAKWVELSVRPAIRAWSRGRNLGLAVVVEDQDGTVLKADKYFKGASCTVGASTPKPIPTIIVDAARRANGLERVDGFFGRNTTTTLPSDVSLLPTIDICTLEFPENYTHPFQITSLRVSACNLRKLHENDQKIAERERIERLASISGLLEPESTRHIRHQRQHLVDRAGEGGQVQFDPRSRMVGSQVVITNAELQQNFNITSINR